MKKTIIYFLSAAVLWGCSSSDEPAGGGVEIKLKPQETQYVKTQNNFAFNFFKKVIEHSAEPNAIVSPLSASMCMSLIANATAGETQQEIVSALGFDSSELDALNKLNYKLAQSLSAVDRRCKVSLANSVWMDNSISAKQDFTNRVSASYGVEFFVENLSSLDAMFKINRWASDKTSGMIQQFLEAPFVDTRVALINALYFKGEWSAKFDTKNTAERTFNNLSGVKSNVPMMKGDMYVDASHDSEGADWVRLGYGSGAFEMILILPDENVLLKDYLKLLDEDTFKTMTGSLKSYKGTVVLPKFDICCEMVLNSLLSSLGVNRIFNNGDFSQFSNDISQLDKVLQKTHIIVDEEGSEMSSVTGNTDPISPGAVEKAKFVFDRPFAFIIHERSSNAILFMGTISEL